MLWQLLKSVCLLKSLWLQRLRRFKPIDSNIKACTWIRLMRRQRSKEMEAEILKYYDSRCVRCHSDYQIQIHELQPRSSFGTKGNAFTLDNSIVICAKC